jgi:hypothetical protein
VRQTRSEGIHSEAYSARIEAVDALRAAGPEAQSDATRLFGAADKLKIIASLYGDAPNATVYAAFSDLVRIVGLTVEWRKTVLDAGADAQRFLTAAKERSSAWLAEYNARASSDRLHAVADNVLKIQSTADVAATAAALAGIPLPIGLFAIPKRESRVHADAAENTKPTELTVAFLKFTIDGKPLAETHYVSPGEAHDLDIEVRVSRWPDGATALVLEPLTIEQAGTYQLPVFSIAAPIGAGPFRLTQKGRAMLAVPQHLNARPYEFKYVAKFQPAVSEQPVEIAGQRTLLLEGVNLASHPLTGYPNLDQKLVAIRDCIRVTPGIGQQDLSNALTLVTPLANFAGQVVQDNLFDAEISEAEFQKRLKQFLRSQPKIGAELEEHPRVAGGITDLSFRGIRLELKSEAGRVLGLADCRQFIGQTTSYAVGSGKRLAVLCVLDCSQKTAPAFPVEDGIDVLVHEQNDSKTFVITVLLQGNLARPSRFSR